jgi:hypothetical protein
MINGTAHHEEGFHDGRADEGKPVATVLGTIIGGSFGSGFPGSGFGSPGSGFRFPGSGFCFGSGFFGGGGFNFGSSFSTLARFIFGPTSKCKYLHKLNISCSVACDNFMTESTF